jgi:hypothetical protein
MRQCINLYIIGGHSITTALNIYFIAINSTALDNINAILKRCF